MKQEPLTGPQALEEGKKLPYALIRQLSRVQLGPVPEQMPELSEILEARFFDGRQEIRLFRQGGEPCGVRLTLEATDRWMDRQETVENPQLGGELSVRYILDFDEDGQCRVETFCLTGWKEGPSHG